MIYYTASVTAKDIPKLDKTTALRVKYTIEQKLAANPILYGSPLGGTLKKLWKLRIGDYRVIYSMEKSDIIVWAIAHRKDVYKLIARRI